VGHKNKEIVIERRHRDLSEVRSRIRKKDRHGFHIAVRTFEFDKDWDLIKDGEVIARASDIERLSNFARRQE